MIPITKYHGMAPPPLKNLEKGDIPIPIIIQSLAEACDND